MDAKHDPSIPIYRNEINATRDFRAGVTVRRDFTGGGNWDCKMSLDGNIYRLGDMLMCLDGISNVRGVGYLESALNSNLVPGPHGVCYSRARLLNVPLNRVDTSENKYPSMGQSAAQINAKYLGGEYIQGYDFPADAVFHSCHVEATPVWARRVSR